MKGRAALTVRCLTRDLGSGPRRARALAAVLAVTLAAPAFARDAVPAECAPLVGTFLTLKAEDPTADPGEVGRSLFAFTRDGHAFMTDSAQGGGDEFQPFSEASGAWTCDGAGESGVAFRASMIDFTFPTDGLPDPQVVRVDVEGMYDPAADALSGSTTVTFFPLGADPFDDTAATADTGYRFAGSKVTVR